MLPMNDFGAGLVSKYNHQRQHILFRRLQANVFRLVETGLFQRIVQAPADPVS